MKNVLAILILILQTSFAFGQVNSFAPLGSSWYYSHYFFTQYGQDFTKIETIGDTIIEGKICSIIYINNAYINASDFPDSIYLFSDSGKVYRYFTEVNQWGLQFDFTAMAGDTITIYGYFFNLDSFLVVVDSIGTININGHVLKTQSYRSIATIWDDQQEVIKE